MTATPATLVTAPHLRVDTLTEGDYRDIYDELRAKASLDRFVAAIRSRVSKAWWSQYERGEVALRPERRNELRQAVGLPELAPSPAQATALAADGTVWRVGTEQPDRAIMLGADVRAVTLHVNGDVRATAAAENGHVTGITRPSTSAAAPSRMRNRRAYFRPCLSQNAAERIGQLEALLAAARLELDAG